MIASGERCEMFERRIAAYLGLSGGVATASGTAALYMALRLLNVGPESEVIVPTYVCSTVLFAVQHLGAFPILCDVDDDWVLSRRTVEPCISEKTQAIIAPHICGIAADVKGLLDFGVPVIEDLAQALGANYNGCLAGALGKITVCSFKAIKPLATGEGGMVLSNDVDLLRAARSMQILAPMSDIQASLGLAQLDQYDRFLRRRKYIADSYFERFADFSHLCMPVHVRQRSMFFRFPLIVPCSFEAVKLEFQKKAIEVRQFIDCLLHRLLGQSSDKFEKAERHYKNTISIPIYPALTDDEVSYIGDATVNILSKIS
jgi:UDP-4-amino-4-deoxy-L-arabinose-oxoglutarate aminotransferase